MKKLLAGLAGLVVLTAAYLLFWPTTVEPVVWTPPVAPSLQTGPYALNDRLKGVQRIAVGVGKGPEGIAIDATGRIYAGYADGRVVTLPPNASTYTELTNTGGRPFGIGFGPLGGLVIADGKRGLLQLGSKPEASVLSRTADGGDFGFTDDVDAANLSHQVFFTDASSKFPFPDYHSDLIEHVPHGRLMRYDYDRKETTVLLKDLYFANGVAVGPDDAYVLVNETGAYRITRYWLKGDKAGTHEVFVDDLPGFPDNLSFNGHDRFWVAIASPRQAALDHLAGNPFLGKLAARLPAFLQPGPARHAFVLGFDLDGKLVANLQYAGDDAYAPITSVEERGAWLYFGSLSEHAIARMPLNRIVSGAPAPPAGWESAPAEPRRASAAKGRDDDDD